MTKLPVGTKLILHYGGETDKAEIANVNDEGLYVVSYDNEQRAKERRGTFGMILYLDQFEDNSFPLWFEVDA